MCGITGAICQNHSTWIRVFNEEVKHRGPDDEGYFSDEHLSLAHRRLAILDLSPNGHQPMLSDDGRYVIIFNGEIYNHHDIRNRLERKYRFRSTSDTETILYGFMEFGVDIFGMMNGIYALGIYDKLSKELILARDQFGVKPLYYYDHRNCFLFASELKAFLKYDDFDRSIDHKALVNYVHYLWGPGEQTPFVHVKKLLPGHYMRISLSGSKYATSLHKFYEIPFNGNYSDKTEEQLIEELERKLELAVKRQLQSDVPVGFFLSGGLDSSAIVAMAKKNLPNQKLICYTIDTGGGAKSYEGFVNDLYYAEKVAKILDVDLKYVKAEPSLIADFDKMIWHLDEPQADMAPLNVLNISSKAREDGFKVLLGGTAGDDLFSGYRRHQSLYYERWLKYVPGSAFSLLNSMTNGFGANKPAVRRLRKIIETRKFGQDKRLASLYSWIDLDANKSLFNKDIAAELNGYDPANILLESLNSINSEKADLNKLLFWDSKYFLTDHNLNYTDKLSMAVGVEARVPFLDLELVDFACNLPLALKMKGKTTKYLLKKLMEKYFPPEIVHRPKSGFGAPVRKWITDDIKQAVNERLDPSELKKIGLFNIHSVQQLVKDNEIGKLDASYTVLSLLAISSWYNQFVK